MTIKHKFHSAKGDGPDSTLVRPSAWDDDHDFLTTSTTPIVLGRQSPGAGVIEELPLSVIFPTGVIVPYAGAAAPTGWLLCYGQSVTQASQPGLYAVIGQTYGAGPGPATFVIPDLRGTTLAGRSNMGGADRGNLPGGATLGQYLGAPTIGGLTVTLAHGLRVALLVVAVTRRVLSRFTSRVMGRVTGRVALPLVAADTLPTATLMLLTAIRVART